jgi:hypothetical protein
MNQTKFEKNGLVNLEECKALCDGKPTCLSVQFYGVRPDFPFRFCILNLGGCESGLYIDIWTKTLHSFFKRDETGRLRSTSHRAGETPGKPATCLYCTPVHGDACQWIKKTCTNEVIPYFKSGDV